MAEKVEKLSVHREKDFMYYVKDSSVWKVQRKQPGIEKGKPEKVADGTFKMDTEFIYFVDRDGDVSRATRAVGGQKRKQTIAPVKLLPGKGSGSKSARPSRTASASTRAAAARAASKPAAKRATSAGTRVAGRAKPAGKSGKTGKVPSRAKASSKSKGTAKAAKGRAGKRKAGKRKPGKR
jgi:hypothetical protein